MTLVLLGASNRWKGRRVALLLKSVDRRWYLLVDRHTRGRTLGLLLNARIDGLHLGGVFRVLRGGVMKTTLGRVATAILATAGLGIGTVGLAAELTGGGS